MTPQEATQIAAEIVALSNRVAPSRTAAPATATVCANCGKSHPGAVHQHQQQRPSGLFAGLAGNMAGDPIPAPPSLEDAIREARTPTSTPASAEPRLQSNGVPEPPDMAAAIRAAREARR